MKKSIRLLLVVVTMLTGLCLGMMHAAALEDDDPIQSLTTTGWSTEGQYKYYYGKPGVKSVGWKKIGTKTYYFHPTDDDAPMGSMATGFTQIEGKRFYFDKKEGYLRYPGWIQFGKYTMYMTPTGNPGTLGAVYSNGVKLIDDGYYYFSKTGLLGVGWRTVGTKKYYFSKDTGFGKRGRAYTGWHSINGAKYYFSKRGIMQTGRWIANKYYVGTDGKLLTNTITPDGYIVSKKGIKKSLANGWVKQNDKTYYYENGVKATGVKTINGKTYYFTATGIRRTAGWVTFHGNKYYLRNSIIQTGWTKIANKKYYFYDDGKMAVNTTIDGVEIGSDGECVIKASILILSGHGMGDTGAVGNYGNVTYYEYKLTRSFASLIQQKFAESGRKISVTMYDQNYDCFQVISGTKVGPDPQFKKYDYVLEIHFNATAVANKDSKGDGKRKGIGMYINTLKKDDSIDREIVKAAASVGGGFTIWGGGNGIMRNGTKTTGLYNARTCQNMGVSYGLLETAFIDDKDDMTFFNKNKDAMAKAIADAICDHFGA